MSAHGLLPDLSQQQKLSPVPRDTDTRTWAGRQAERSPESMDMGSSEFISSGDTDQENGNEARFPMLKSLPSLPPCSYLHTLFLLSLP